MSLARLPSESTTTHCVAAARLYSTHLATSSCDMNMKTLSIAFVILLFVSKGDSTCDGSDELLANICYNLYQQMEDALLDDKTNIYRLQKAFFYGPNANPVLIKVIYNISYSENVTEDALREPNYCTSDTNSSNQITVNETRQVILGWTSSGVFTVFHPLTLNFMQIQIPFVIMKVMFEIFKKIDPIESGPEAKTFLWDGGSELPTLHINLHITSLPCLPSAELFNSTLIDINALVGY